MGRLAGNWRLLSGDHPRPPGDWPAPARRTEGIAAAVPPGRIGQARGVASAVAFLLSDEASYVIGAHLSVEGGI